MQMILKELIRIFDTDEGARYVGEFAIGVNPYILNSNAGYFI